MFYENRLLKKILLSLTKSLCCKGGGLVGVAGFDPTVYKTQMQSYASSLTRGAEPSRQLEDAIKAPLMSLCAR